MLIHVNIFKSADWQNMLHELELMHQDFYILGSFINLDLIFHFIVSLCIYGNSTMPLWYSLLNNIKKICQYNTFTSLPHWPPFVFIQNFCFILSHLFFQLNIKLTCQFQRGSKEGRDGEERSFVKVLPGIVLMLKVL